MADPTKDIKAQLSALGAQDPTQGVGPTEALPPLPPAPPTQQMSTGVAIARALSVFTSGLGDPQRAAAMLQYFQTQDMAARADAQQRYANAVAQTQAQRENIQYKESVRGRKVSEALQVRGQNINILQAQLQAIQLEIAATQDPGRKEHLLLTMNEMQKLIEAQAPTAAKPIQYKNPLEAMMALGSSDKGKALMDAIQKGKGSEFIQGLNQELLAATPSPKAIFPKDMFSMIDSMEMEPAARALWKLAASQAPDPISGPATPGEASEFSSTMRQLASTDPQAHDAAVHEYAKALYLSGQVPSLDAGYEMAAEVEAGTADPTHLAAPGTFKPKLGGATGHWRGSPGQGALKAMGSLLSGKPGTTGGKVAGALGQAVKSNKTLSKAASNFARSGSFFGPGEEQK